MALVTVMGAIFLLTTIVVGIVSQVRSQLRAGRLEVDVAQGQLLIWSGMNDVVQQAMADPVGFASAAPDPTAPPPAGWAPCVPVPINPSDRDGPAYCTDLLQRKKVQIYNGKTSLYYVEIPVAIRWRVRKGEPEQVSYGWILIDQKNKVTPFYFHRWCTITSWEYGKICEQGG